MPSLRNNRPAGPQPQLNVHLISLGCPKNLVDSEWILGGLTAAGARVVDDPRQADTIVINTCGFIEDAKKESVETILQAVRLKMTGSCQNVLVTGCLAERYREEILKEIPEVDRVWGARNVEIIPQEMTQFLQLRPLSGKTLRRFLTVRGGYAYLKIAEGCDNLCSFCAIPAIRGPQRSRSVEAVVAEARELAAAGVKELILVSQDTTRYGRDLQDRASLAKLLQALHEVEGIVWIRMLYLYPDRITPELIDTVAELPKVCPYFDIPVQHISDRILQAMRRGSRRATIEKVLEKIRSRIPEAAVRTSVIVGFPGETDAEFEELLDFLEQARFDRLGVFRFSPEEGTPAAGLPGQIPEALKQERYEAVMSLQQEISLHKNRSLVGKTLPVMVDGRDGVPGILLGRTKWDAPEIDQTVSFQASALPGEFLNVRIVGASFHDLKGEVVPANE